MFIELEPDFPSAEELQRYADRERERIPHYELLWLRNELMWRGAWAQAKEEFLRKRTLGAAVHKIAAPIAESSGKVINARPLALPPPKLPV
jgi:hypothetical protein